MYHNVPQHILDALKGEPVDFIVQSSRDYTKRALGWIMVIGVSFFWWIFIFPFMFAIPLLDLFLSGSTSISINGTNQTFTLENPWLPIGFALIPAAFSLIFIVPLAYILYKGLKYLRKKGPWYAGTNKNLVEFSEKNIRYFSWGEFDKAIQTKLNPDNTLDIILSRNTPNSITVHQTAPSTSKKKRISSKQSKNSPTVIHIRDLSIRRFLFMNKVGLLRLTNGSLVLNMIRHNMERVKSKAK